MLETLEKLWIQILEEFTFNTARSSGNGGQHVNKVETKVILQWNIQKCVKLSDEQRILILDRLSNRINKDGILQVSCEESRSQLNNKRLAEKRLFSLLEEALKVKAKRKPRKVSKSAHRKRLKDKKSLSEKKASRQNRINPNDD